MCLAMLTPLRSGPVLTSRLYSTRSSMIWSCVSPGRISISGPVSGRCLSPLSALASRAASSSGSANRARRFFLPPPRSSSDPSGEMSRISAAPAAPTPAVVARRSGAGMGDMDWYVPWYASRSGAAGAAPADSDMLWWPVLTDSDAMRCVGGPGDRSRAMPPLRLPPPGSTVSTLAEDPRASPPPPPEYDSWWYVVSRVVVPPRLGLGSRAPRRGSTPRLLVLSRPPPPRLGLGSRAPRLGSTLCVLPPPPPPRLGRGSRAPRRGSTPRLSRELRSEYATFSSVLAYSHSLGWA